MLFFILARRDRRGKSQKPPYSSSVWAALAMYIMVSMQKMNACIKLLNRSK